MLKTVPLLKVFSPESVSCPAPDLMSEPPPTNTPFHVSVVPPLVMSKFADVVGLRTAMGTGGIAFGISAAAMLYTHRRLCMRQPVAPSTLEREAPAGR